MAHVEKISVALTPDMASIIKAAVECGQYATVSEVIRDALRDWIYKHDLRGYSIEEIRQQWQEGINSGPSPFSRIDDVKDEARKRLKQGERKTHKTGR